MGDDGGEGQMWRVKKLLESLVPFRLTRRLNTGNSTIFGPVQLTAKRHDGMTALIFLVLSSTECLEICIVWKNSAHVIFSLALKITTKVYDIHIYKCKLISGFSQCWNATDTTNSHNTNISKYNWPLTRLLTSKVLHVETKSWCGHNIYKCVVTPIYHLPHKHMKKLCDIGMAKCTHMYSSKNWSGSYM